MDKYIILLPLNYNDGSPVSDEVLEAAIGDLYALAEGYTMEGQVKGAYRMQSGRKQEDVLLKVWVMIPPEKAQKLRTLIRYFCRRLQQESIWLEKSSSLVELVQRDVLNGDNDDQGPKGAE